MAATVNHKTLLICFSILPFLCSALPCADYRFPNGKSFVSCTDLPVLNFSLHWTYNPSLHVVDIAVRSTSAAIDGSRWIAWAINPVSKGMVGSQALVALQKLNGSVKAYTSPITSYRTRLEEGNLSFPVRGVSAITKNNEIVLFATLELESNVTTTVNHLWQEGPVKDNIPIIHKLSGPNVQSVGTLDFLSGKIEIPDGGNLITKWKIAHGILNAISWGFLMPIGIVFARHGKLFLSGPVWFYTHVTCQCTALLLGSVGSLMAVVLGTKSTGFQNSPHWFIGIALLPLGFIQVVVAKFLRPNKEHKLRIYWNIFHYLVGYAIVALSIANVLIGLKMSHLGRQWKFSYIGALVLLGCIALILEALAFKRKMDGSEKSLRHKTEEDKTDNSPFARGTA